MSPQEAGEPGQPGRARRGSAGRPKGSKRAKSQPKRSDAQAVASPTGTIDARVHHTERRIWTGGNRILAALPVSEMAVVNEKLISMAFRQGQVVYAQQSEFETVYFPDTTTVSLLSRMESDVTIEVGTVGNEGMAGLSVFLGSDVSVPEVIAQIPGAARQMSAEDFRSIVPQLQTLRALLSKCAHAFITQVSQTAACNRLHGIEQRCARWLLMTHDRVGGADTFPLTHRFLSFMLGVRRAGVTEALRALKLGGLITSTSGQVTILDRAGLEASSCECYEIVRMHAIEPFSRGVNESAPTAVRSSRGRARSVRRGKT